MDTMNKDKENLSEWVIFRVTPTVKKLLKASLYSKDLSKQVRHLIYKTCPEKSLGRV
jgi:hypothetical protein